MQCCTIKPDRTESIVQVQRPLCQFGRFLETVMPQVDMGQAREDFNGTLISLQGIFKIAPGHVVLGKYQAPAAGFHKRLWIPAGDPDRLVETSFCSLIIVTETVTTA